MVFALGVPLLSLLYLFLSVSLMRIHAFAEASDVSSARLLIRIEKPALLTSLTIRIEVNDLMLDRKKTENYMVTDRDTYCPLGLGHCGTYTVRILKASLQDPFGLFSMRLRGDRETALTVRPQTSADQDIPSLQDLLPHAFRPKPDFSYSEIYEYRDYRPSDPIRSINWKLSQKRDSMIVREPQETAEKELRILLVLTSDGPANDRALAKLKGIQARMTEASRKYVLVCPSQKLVFPVASDDDLEKAMDGILRTKVTETDAPDKEDYFRVVTGGTER
ncbi:MAG: DUF58 domain-containing protein [Solobacterium sp.]|nr:DUF58 domain-containing protein [Solobacterium sp.]